MEPLLKTLQIKCSINKTSLIRTKILVPTDHTNEFLPLKEGNLYISAKVAKNSWSQSVRYREPPLCINFDHLFCISQQSYIDDKRLIAC